MTTSRASGVSIAALQTIAPAVGEATLGALHASQPPPVDVLLTALLNDLAALGDTVLVLDDYHVIEFPPIEEALTFFVDHLPPQFRLVIATATESAAPAGPAGARERVHRARHRPAFQSPPKPPIFSTR